MQPKAKDFVDKDTLKIYSDIDGLKVVEEYLLFKGTDHIRNSMQIHISHLEKMAHIEYGLKVNETNKLYVGMYLDKYYKKNGLFKGSDMKYVRVPKEIFDRVDKLHARFKTADNQQEE